MQVLLLLQLTLLLLSKRFTETHQAFNVTRIT
jgi:hypothetical protein